MEIKICEIGDELGVIIPKEILEKLMVYKEDFLYVTETEKGILLSPHDSESIEGIEPT